uniref:Plexin B3 n=1 Tax=Salmo trutta TaxID=8032 RepID=A0A673X2I4_SALTR
NRILGCLPPIVPKDCNTARLTPNTNKILLLEEGLASAGSEVGPRSLIVCGTLFQGICEKRSLGNVSKVLYQTSNPVDTQYVAANDPRVSTVGVVLNQKGVGLMLVGRGYTSKGPSDIPPITTRRLAPSSSPARQAFSQDEELGKLVVGSYSEYNNNFISAHRHGDHVYFLFSRRDMWHRKEYRTYVSRLCAVDRSFYSYVEVPLECSGGYNLAQGATLAEHQGRPALFVAMAAGQASTPTATGRSALCVYGMSELDAALQRAQELCYTEGGRGRKGQEEAYIEYEVSSKCLRLPKDSLKKYPCGGEHTPSPIASAVPLSATPSLTTDTQLTAVTTTTEAGHTIALLGDKNGWLHKVFLQPDTTGTLYLSVIVDKDSPVNADLLLDQSGQNVYVLTDSKVSKVSVSQCEQQPDCRSCLSVRDPYCGWCVLEGRYCTPTQNTLQHHLSYYGDIIFYDCRAVGRLNATSPCMACVGSVWPCNWCVLDGLCTHNNNNNSCPKQHTIHNSVALPTRPYLPSLPTRPYLPGPAYKALPTRPYLPSPTYQALPTRPCLPGPTYQALPTQLTYQALPTRPYLPGPTYQALPTRPYLPGPAYQALPTRPYLPSLPTRPYLPGPTYQALPTRPYLPSPTYQALPTRPTCQALPTRPYLPDPTYQALPTSPLLSALSSLPPSLCPPLSALSSLPSPLCPLLSALLSLPTPLCPLLSPPTPLCPLLSLPAPLYLPLSALSSLCLPLSALLSQFQYPLKQLEYSAPIYLQRGSRRVDSAPILRRETSLLYSTLCSIHCYHLKMYILQLYDCSVGQSDCSQCRAVPSGYGCVWCGGETPGCVYNLSCSSSPGPADTCPSPQITQIQPVSGPVEGGVLITIRGSNLGMHYQDIQGGVTVAGVSCLPQSHGYLISTRIVCELQPSKQETEGPVIVTGPVSGGTSLTVQSYSYGINMSPSGPVSGGTSLTVQGTRLRTGQRKDLTAYVGQQPCYIVEEVNGTHLVCRTSPSNQTAELTVRVLFGKAERSVPGQVFHYMEDPVITEAFPAESFYEGGRSIKVSGRSLYVVQQPMITVWVEPKENTPVRMRRRRRNNQLVFNSTVPKEHCTVVSSSEMTCLTPRVTPDTKVMGVWFELDNVKVAFESVAGKTFSYYPNPELFALNRDDPDTPYRFKPGGVIAVEGKDLTRAMTRGEVVARLGDQECEVKTLDNTHLYCEPPEKQPASLGNNKLPSLRVVMGKLNIDLGTVQYDTEDLSPVPLAAQVGLAAGATVVVLVVLVIILMYRRKSKQALRDYKKVLVQLETLEINVGDQCRKEFTDLMTEMMDLSSDVGGPGIPLLDYKTYAERVFFPGQRGAPLSQNLDLPESRRQTVEQGLGQLNNLLNNRLFLIRFIHTLEAQQNFSQRDRGYVASLLTMALHDQLEYFTDVMKTLLGDLVKQYVAKNPKLMLRRTETVVEKMLTNWMSICLYSFLKEVAGEPLYMLYRAIKYQVDKGPVDAVTGKAKRTLNDSHLLREDIDYCSITLVVKSGVEVQPCPVKVLDTDTITQVKDKILDQIYKGAPFSQRPAADSLDLEWRSGQAGHLTLSDDDVTAVFQGRWRKLNTLQHYKVPDGATVALIPGSAAVMGIHQVYQTGEKMPMLEGEEGLRLWHLVKSSEEPEIPKHSSMRERERAKAIPEIYLTRLLSMKGTLQKFVDDVFVAILNTKRPPPIAVRFFFDFLDDMAEKHGIDDPDTVHIWKTNSLPLRFWVNILKNPQFIFDVQVTDSVDAVLSVIAQTFIDSCTTTEHKVGRDSPVNKLLYAREIPRYKQLVAVMCIFLFQSFASEMNSLVALHELYKYISKYYDQIIASLEEDAAGQKMQLAYRLQQVAALVENKVTDL